MSKPGAIKISLGAKKNPGNDNRGVKTLSKPAQPAAVKRGPGSKLSLGGDDEEQDDQDGKSVEVTHFDQAKGGAHHEEVRASVQKAAERIIECPPNRDWLKEATKKRQKSALPGRNRGAQGVEESDSSQKRMTYGLNVSAEADKDTDRPTKPLGRGDRDIESTEGAVNASVREERAYEDDLEKAPDAPSLSDYDKVPVEGFGLAMLRGMGYKEKDKEEKNKPSIDVRRRPALLGIGAKPLEEDTKKSPSGALVRGSGSGR